MFNKTLLLLFVLSLSLYAKTSVEEAVFESGISLYGKVGTATLTYEENLEKSTYKIEIVAQSSGFLKALFHNRVDTFVSEGKIKEGVYIPLKYTKIESDAFSNKTTSYIFDYEKRSVLKKTQKHYTEVSTEFDPMQMRIVKHKEKKYKENSQNIELRENDFLSLYLNLMKGNLQKGELQALDQKERDSVSIFGKNLLSINKENKKTVYAITLEDDDNSVFFKKASSEMALFGSAYLQKIAQSKELRN